MLDLSSTEEVVWHVQPLATPRVLRPCARCGGVRAFASSDKFRCNAQRRTLDVWLLYRCSICGRTWKREVVSRRAVAHLEPGLLAKFLANDLETARAIAHARDGGLSFEAASDVTVQRPPLLDEPLRARLDVAVPCRGRLDGLLAGELGCSRSEVRRRVRSGEIRLRPHGEAMLSRPPRDGARIEIDVQRTGGESPSAAPEGGDQRPRSGAPSGGGEPPPAGALTPRAERTPATAAARR